MRLMGVNTVAEEMIDILLILIEGKEQRVDGLSQFVIIIFNYNQNTLFLLGR